MRLSYLGCEITETGPIYAIFTKAVVWCFVSSLHITLVKWGRDTDDIPFSWENRLQCLFSVWCLDDNFLAPWPICTKLNWSDEARTWAEKCHVLLLIREACILLWWEVYQVFKDMQLWLKVFKNSYTYWIHCPSINHIITDRRKWRILHRGHDRLLNLSFQIQ